MTTAPASDSIRPFRVNVPEAALIDLRRRIADTRLPEKETVADQSQGVPLTPSRSSLRYWADRLRLAQVEAQLNALPNFITEIDGLDIHFIHVPSKHEHALPLLVSHGWPGSVIEQLKIIEPLTNPTAHGGSASDAFHLVIPSMPGYGFSGKPTTTGSRNAPERVEHCLTRMLPAPRQLVNRLRGLRRLSRRDPNRLSCSIGEPAFPSRPGAARAAARNGGDGRSGATRSHAQRALSREHGEDGEHRTFPEVSTVAHSAPVGGPGRRGST